MIELEFVVPSAFRAESPSILPRMSRQTRALNKGNERNSKTPPAP